MYECITLSMITGMIRRGISSISRRRSMSIFMSRSLSMSMSGRGV